MLSQFVTHVGISPHRNGGAAMHDATGAGMPAWVHGSNQDPHSTDQLHHHEPGKYFRWLTEASLNKAQLSMSMACCTMML